ncbi:MAG: isoprenylcysteine carboxylmethyltransferase family protein [Vicinamibacterales bacterium]
MNRVALAALAVFVPMVVEAIVSARHDRQLRALGAVEPPGDVYRVMLFAYPAAFVVMLAEGARRGFEADGLATTGTAVFVIGKALKYWAIASLGTRWTFRVLVPPGSTRIARGPYRWFAHPNYAGVALELTGVAIAAHAMLTGLPAVLAFCTLLGMRARVEESALLKGRMPPG